MKLYPPIKNFGNTCYISVILLALFNNKLLIDYFQNNYNFENIFISTLQSNFVLYKKYHYDHSLYDSSNLTNLIKFKYPQYLNKNQHDANELLLNLLIHLTEIKDISNLFTGNIKNIIYCKSCKNYIENFETFYQLEIPRNVKLRDFFNQYGVFENLFDYKCDECKLNNCCITRILKHFPKILIFNIKKNSNINDIEYELILHINNIKYELYCICCHASQSSDEGHYVTILKNKQKWFLYDDFNIYNLSKPDFKYAYILFYSQLDS